MGAEGAGRHAAHHGTPADAGFVTLLSQCALGCQPDAAGQAHWNDALATGTLDRARILLGFAGSSEAQMRLAPPTEGGITFA